MRTSGKPRLKIGDSVVGGLPCVSLAFVLGFRLCFLAFNNGITHGSNGGGRVDYDHAAVDKPVEEFPLRRQIKPLVETANGSP
jgi:hypothetical protein